MKPISSDESLRKSLTQLISSSLQADSRDFQRKWYFNERTERLIGEISRRTLTCSLGLFQGFDLTCDISTWNKKSSFRERLGRFMRLKAAPKFYYINVALLLYLSIFISMNLYFQYIYDVNSARLVHVKSRIGNSTTTGSNQLPYKRFNAQMAGSETWAEAEFGTKARAARSWLKFIGSARLEWSFVTEIIYLEFWILALLFLIIGPVYLKFNELAYFSWTRWLYDEAAECQYCTQSTLLELESLERLMILATQIELQETREAIEEMNHNRSQRQVDFGPSGECRRRASQTSYQEIIMEFDKLTFEVARSPGKTDAWLEPINVEHQLGAMRLREVALHGRLVPLNVSRARINKLTLLMPCLFLGLLAYNSVGFFYSYFYLVGVFEGRGKMAELTSIWDIHEALTQAYLLLIVFVSAGPMTLLSYLTAYDQRMAAKKLKQLIWETIDRSEFRYSKLLYLKNSQTLMEKDHKLASNLIKALEEDLLALIVQYRLFIREYKLAMGPFSIYGIIYLWAGLSMGLFARAHGPYMFAELKPLSVSFGYAGLVPCYCYLVPVCQLHDDCLAAYKSLHNLIAQATQFETSIPEVQDFFTLKFALLVLRRELIEPKQAMSKFTLRILSLAVTKTTLLKMTFWVSLIVIPMLTHSPKSDDGLLSSLLNDPLGIYTW